MAIEKGVCDSNGMLEKMGRLLFDFMHESDHEFI